MLELFLESRVCQPYSTRHVGDYWVSDFFAITFVLYAHQKSTNFASCCCQTICLLLKCFVRLLLFLLLCNMQTFSPPAQTFIHLSRNYSTLTCTNRVVQHHFSCFLHVTELLSAVYFGSDCDIYIVFFIALCVCFMYCSPQGEEELLMTPFIFMSYVCLVTALDSSVITQMFGKDL